MKDAGNLKNYVKEVFLKLSLNYDKYGCLYIHN